jgi:alpha,alpha-trehalase
MALRRYNGTYPTSFVESGLQWDAPNCWPPHQYIALQALRALPVNVSSGAIPQPPNEKSGFELVPSGQLGLRENDLPGQLIGNGKNASSSGSRADINALNGTFVNGGSPTAGEGWRDALARGLANRYFTSALCSW